MEKFFRQTVHLNQQELADLIGVSKSAIGLYECGLRQLSAEAYTRLQLLNNAWLLFVKEGLPPGALITTAPEDLSRYQKMVETALQKASTNAIRFSQLLEKMTKYSNLLEQKKLFLYYLRLKADSDLFPEAVLNKIQRDIKKQLKRCDANQLQMMAFRLKCCTALQQLAVETRRSIR
ncbi:helix-turn-helix domain-containing protein [Niabella sp. CJ426]|uniref:helix-turn-helix domain-containing protein n=1 Tax=Niabella sp. CJ426 TaxID=3393740 RepID=UPI003D047286